MQWAGRVVLGLWVALSVLTWAPRFGEAADATVTGTGRFVFQKLVHGQWVEIGIRRARVEMCDDDQVLGCQLMAVGQTDDDGYFSVTGRAGDFFGDLPDPPVKVIAQSDAATVEDTAVRWDLLLPVGAPLRPDQRIDGRLRDHLHGDGLRLHHRGRCRRPEGCLGSPQPGRRSPPLHADVHAGHSGSRRALGQGAVARGSDGVRSARLVLGERHDQHRPDHSTRTLFHEAVRAPCAAALRRLSRRELQQRGLRRQGRPVRRRDGSLPVACGERGHPLDGGIPDLPVRGPHPVLGLRGL